MTGGSDISIVLNVTVLSMCVVFLTLLCISFVLQLFKVVFKEDNTEKKVSKTVNKTKAKKDNKKIKSNVNLNDNKVLVAAFTAAIASSEKKRSSNIKIKSIKKVS